MCTLFLAPPLCKPSEPPISAGAAAEVVRRLGGKAQSLDLSLEWHNFALKPQRLEQALRSGLATGVAHRSETSLRAAIQAQRRSPATLRRADTYADWRVYTSAINEYENALRTAALPYAGVRLGTAMIALERPARRLECSAVLEDFGTTPGPFDSYFLEDLIPRLERSGVQQIALSVAFQQQMPAAVRLARLLEQCLPSLRRILGGPLVAAWKAAGLALQVAPLKRFHQVLAGSDQDLATLAEPEDGQNETRRSGPLSPALEEVEWGSYLAPVPIVPAALGLGCYWRRCTFCPDQLQADYRPCPGDSLAGWLRHVAAAFPGGAMIHWTDSALPPKHLERIALTIQQERLPLQWHGFVRPERAFAQPGFAQLLAAGGCAMLQFGVETTSERLLERLGKGGSVQQTREVLRACATAGIRNHVYLVFGVPGETDEDREQTLAFVEEEAASMQALNTSLLNLPKGSPMHRQPDRYGITEIRPFHADTDLSLYDDFRCEGVHTRLEARRWIERRLLRSKAVRAMSQQLRTPFKANHLCFL